MHLLKILVENTQEVSSYHLVNLAKELLSCLQVSVVTHSDNCLPTITITISITISITITITQTPNNILPFGQSWQRAPQWLPSQHGHTQ